MAGRPSAAQDANVIVVTAATAARYGLRSVADLARVAPRLAFGLSVVALTMAFRRWRHLLIFGCSLAFLELAGFWINRELTRPRPYGVPIIAGWAGYSAPALPAGILSTLLIGIAYCLVVPGRPRSCAKAAIAVAVTVFCLACLYLAVDHVDDILLGVALGVAIPVSAFRFFTPNEVFPVAYRRGNTAHVDVTGRRGEAIRQGMLDQLGFTVTGITPVGLASSAGSTPLRLRTGDAPQEYLFAKLYTKGHVRADRWYKIWRTAAGTDAEIASGQASFWLNSAQAGVQAVTITLTATCDTSGAQQIPSDQAGTRRFERPLSLVPEYSDVRYYTFSGGCATYQYAFAPGASPALATAVDSAVAFIPRSALVGYVRRTENLALCGRGAACPG